MSSHQREVGPLLPGPPSPDLPPVYACAVMAAELDALARDIAAARAHARPGRAARRPPAAGLERVPLASGRAIVIRPLERSDRSELLHLFHRLGALSRFWRFLAPLEHLSERQLAHLTELDHVTHEALIALDAETGEGVGVARYRCEESRPSRASFAVAVADAWQGDGAGSALLSRLTARARENGVEALVGSTAACNRRARRLAADAAVDGRSGTLRLTLAFGA